MKRLALFSFRAALVLVILQSGCERWRPPVRDKEAPSDPPWFEDITEKVGLDFVHDAGPLGSFFMPQSVGSGAALFDGDGDGRLDIYLLQNGGPNGARNRLYRQDEHGRFHDISRGSGLDFAGYNMGVAIGDVNNDGWPDVLVTQYGGVKLLLNQGNGVFRDITEAAGLSNPAWGTSAAFLDYDRDGWLDLVVVNYIDYDPTWSCTTPSGVPDYCAPKTFHGRVSRLFHNRGAAGVGQAFQPDGPIRQAGKPDLQAAAGVRFDDVTVASGLGRRPGPGLGVCCADFDGDGWPDIFIANDGTANHLWINRQDGTFQEQGVARGLAYNALGQPEAGMGVALGDIDGDGLFDLFVTHLTEEKHRLWRQSPRGLFQDRTVAVGLAEADGHGTGFGTVLADFDLDGSLDLALVNGNIVKGTASANPALGPHWGLYAQRNQLFANDDAGHFHDISSSNPALCGTANVARGLACGDVDGDGAVDLLVTSIAGRARLLRNVAPRRGHWLRVRAEDETRHRDAVGAEVRVKAGGKTWLRGMDPANSFLCSSENAAHFGLGGLTEVETIEVRWPDGRRERFADGGVDRAVRLVKGRGQSP